MYGCRMSSEYVNFSHPNEDQSIESVEFDSASPLLEISADGNALVDLAPSNQKEISIFKKRKWPLITIYLIILSVLLSVALIGVSLVWAASNKSSGKNKRNNASFKHILQLSDTHLDIYYHSNITNKNFQGCRNKKHKKGDPIQKADTTAIFGRLKCDSPSHLLESLKDQLSDLKKESDVEFVIMTGDQSAHSYEYFDVDVLDSVLWSIENSTKYIADALPGVPIYMTVGNNDLEYDYLPPLSDHSAFYQKLYEIFIPYVFPESSIGDTEEKKKFKQSFELGGYYSVNLDGGSILLIVLNTNYWSVSSYKRNTNVTIIGDIQLAWLRDQLRSAKQKDQKVLISGHIPPGMSAFDGSSFWMSNYTQSYIELVSNEFSNAIIAQLYGHIHSDRMKLQYLKDTGDEQTSSVKSFLLTAPSITPVYGSNPAFRMYDYDPNQKSLSNYDQYYLDLAASNVNKKPFWFKEYNFEDTYKFLLNAGGVAQIVNKFLDPSSPAWSSYYQHIKTKMGGIKFNQRYNEYCAAKHVEQKSYSECREAYKNNGE